MERWSWIAAIAAVILPILSAVIMLWSDVQTMKKTKLEYRELAQFQLEVTGKLSTIDESIRGLDSTIERLLQERRVAYEQTHGSDRG